MADQLVHRSRALGFGMGRSGWNHVGVALLLVLSLCYTTSQHALSSPNERSRLYLTVAMFEQHSFAIDAVRLRFGSVLDEAVFNGHYFTDKAPGASLLALVPYAVLRLFVPAQQISIEWLLDIARYGVMVPCGMVAWIALETLCRRLGSSAGTARWVALVTALGTPAFHYSAAFFGHQIVATCFIVALCLLSRQGPRGAPGSSLRAWFAGILVGLAGITEYQSLIGVLAITGFCVAVSRGRRAESLLPYLLGGFPFAVWLALYQKACFGGYYELSYHHLSDPFLAQLHRRGIGGVELPSAVGTVGTLFSLHRGLFATSPWFALVPWGLWGLWRRGRGNWALLIAGLATVELWFVAASITWDAGWGYGSRLLVPVLPLLALGVAAALHEGKGSASVAAIASASASPDSPPAECPRRGHSALWGLANSAALVGILSFQAVTALFPEPPNELLNPWVDVVVPLAGANLVAPNLGARLLGLSGWQSLLPLAFAVFALLVVLARAARQGCGSWRFIAWLPTLPALWLFIVVARGPSATPEQHAALVQFVGSVNEISLYSWKIRAAR